MSTNPRTPFTAENPLKPYTYVDELIKLVRAMAPNATQNQWKKFGIVARNIERSHEFYLCEAYKAADIKEEEIQSITTAFLQMQLNECSEEIKELQEKILKTEQRSIDLKVEYICRSKSATNW